MVNPPLLTMPSHTRPHIRARQARQKRGLDVTGSPGKLFLGCCNLRVEAGELLAPAWLVGNMGTAEPLVCTF
jgi:hypothetical protein